MATPPTTPVPPVPPAPPLGPPTSPAGYPLTPPAYTGPYAGSGGAGGGGPIGPLGSGWQPQGAPQPGPTPGGRGRKGLVAALLVLALLAGALGGFGLSRVGQHDDSTATAPTGNAQQVPQLDPNGSSGSSGLGQGQSGLGSQDEGSGQGSQGSGSNGTADGSAVAAKVTPGVVNINVLTAQGQGAGTGMILTSGGIVLTNNHVVRGATRIVVTDADSGDRYEAKVLGTAPTKDVALIQLVDAHGLDTVKTGDSDSVKVGDAVVAIGNAGGQGGMPSVVTGNVVALGRSITASDESGSEAQRLSNLIQINANIVPGDSGGPLANTDGEVIGINAAASSTNEVSSNDEGYSIPIKDALAIVEQIKAGRSSDVVHIGTRGVLGVQVTSVSADDPFGTQGQAPVAGASVAGVADGSGAATAGVTAGSTITALDGKKISSAEALTTALANAKPGDKVKLTWTDPDGQSHTSSVTLTEGPPD